MSRKEKWEKIKEKIKKKMTKRKISFLIVFLFIVYVAVMLLPPQMDREMRENVSFIPYTEFQRLLDEDQIRFVFLNNSSTMQFIPDTSYLEEIGLEVTEEFENLIELLDGKRETSIDGKILPSKGPYRFITENPAYPEFRSELLERGIRVFAFNPANQIMFFILSTIQIMIPVILIIGFLMFYQRSMDPKENEITTKIPDINFENIAGYSTLKKDSKYILDFLKNPAKYTDIGARLPNGVIFYGPPGTGKTLMAKAIAGEAQVPFFKVNGSDFVELYVGLGARRVRKLYKTARKNAPCIVFIDEIDSVGGARGQNRGTSEDDKTLTALLNELDGFTGNEGVITIAATNRLQDLDPALKRPGRFDRQLAVPLPDKDERLSILTLYSKKKKLSENVSLVKLSEKTLGFSPSELENLLNESAIKAVTKGHDLIMQEDVDDAYLRILIKGDKKENPSDSEDQRKIVAYHEAGHAIIGHLLGSPILEVSILPTTSGAGGYTLNQPKEGLQSKADMKNRVKMLYGGRAAETLIASSEDDITTGAVGDIEQATQIISQIIKTWGMHDSVINLDVLGMTRPSDDYIKEAKALGEELFRETKDMLLKNRDILDKLADTLLEKSIIDSEHFIRLVNKEDEFEENKEISQISFDKILKDNNKINQ